MDWEREFNERVFFGFPYTKHRKKTKLKVSEQKNDIGHFESVEGLERKKYARMRERRVPFRKKSRKEREKSYRIS